MTTVTVTLRPIGRGGWAPITLSYDPRVRAELPAPLQFIRGQRVELLGHVYRVARVQQ